MSRPWSVAPGARKPADSPDQLRRRAQYRNAKARKRGKPVEEIAPLAHRRPPRWKPRPLPYRGRRIVVKHIVTGDWVVVTVPE